MAIGRQGFAFGELHIDRAYVNSPVVASVVTNGGAVLAKPWALRAPKPLQPKADFRTTRASGTITCPAGEVEPFEPGETVHFDPRCGAHASVAPTAPRRRPARAAAFRSPRTRPSRRSSEGRRDLAGAREAPSARRRRARPGTHRRAQGRARALPRRAQEPVRPASRLSAPESRGTPSRLPGGSVNVGNYRYFNLFGALGAAC